MIAEVPPSLPLKRLATRFVDAVNDGNLAAIDEVLADEYVLPGGGGREQVKEALVRYRGAVPDARWVIQEQVAEGETVMTRFLACGTHQGPLLGLPPTGVSMAVPGVLLSYCRSLQIHEQWLLVDLLGMLQQLEVMPNLPLDQVVVAARLQRWSAERLGRGRYADRRA